MHRDTQTDESEPESSNTLNMDTQRQEIEALQAELLATKKQLVESQSQTAVAIKQAQDLEEQVKAIKAKAEKEIDEVKKQAAEQLALLKFGLERFSSDNDSIRFYTSFPSYEHLKVFFLVC